MNIIIFTGPISNCSNCAPEKENTSKRLAAFKTYSLRLYNYAEKYKNLSHALVGYYEGDFKTKKIGKDRYEPSLACYHDHPNSRGEFYVKYIHVDDGNNEKNIEEAIGRDDDDNSSDDTSDNEENTKLRLRNFINK